MSACLTVRLNVVRDPAGQRGGLVRHRLGILFHFVRMGREVDGNRAESKKADAAEHRKVFHHVGLLVIEPPGMAGLPFD